MFDKKHRIYGVSSLGERGQIVIPIKMREDLKLKKGDNFVFFTKDSFLGMIREDDMTKILRDMLGQIEGFKKDN